MQYDNKTIACDIDNTVADQLAFYEKMFDSATGRVPDQASANVNLIKYEVIKDSIHVLNKFAKYYKICWVTARNEENRITTIKWLRNNNFPVDSIHLVGRNQNKLKILAELQPDIYFDDMKYNYEKLNPLSCTRFMESLKQIGIRYEIVKYNWKEILHKYIKHKA